MYSVCMLAFKKLKYTVHFKFYEIIKPYTKVALQSLSGYNPFRDKVTFKEFEFIWHWWNYLR